MRNRKKSSPEELSRLGARMRQLIKRSGKLQKEVAEEMGVPETTLSRYVRGDREPYAPYLRKFEEAVGVSQGALYRDDDVTEKVMGLSSNTSDSVLSDKSVRTSEEQGTGSEHDQGDRRIMLELSGNVHAVLKRETGTDWDLLRDYEKLEILAWISRTVADRKHPQLQASG